MIKKIITSLTTLSLLLLGGCEEDATTYSNTNPVAEYGTQVDFTLPSTLSCKAGEAVGITLVGDDFSQNTKWIVDTDLTSLYPNTEQCKIYVESETLSQDVQYLIYYPHQFADAESGLVNLSVADQSDVVYAKYSASTSAVDFESVVFVETMANVTLNFTMIEGQGSLPSNLTATLSNIYSEATFDPTTGEVSSGDSTADGVWSDVDISSAGVSTISLFPQEDLSALDINLYNAYGDRYLVTFTEDDLSAESWVSGESYTYNVQVEKEPSAVTDVTLACNTAGVEIGGELEITASLVEGTLYDSVEWSSNSENATVVWDDLVCTVTGVAVGDATITMTMHSSDEESDPIVRTLAINVTAEKVLVTSIDLKVDGDSTTSDSTILNVDQTLTLSTIIAPTYATDSSCDWVVSGDSSAIEIDAKTGLVRGLAEGTATITVTAKDGSAKSATYTITVIDAGDPEVGYYYYVNNINSMRFTYSEATSENKTKYAGYGYTVTGIVYSVDAEADTAMAMHIDSPYGFFAWAKSGSDYTSAQVPGTSSSCGRTNMDAVQRVDATFSNFNAFKYVDGLNGTNGATSYDSNSMNVWYMPANTELVTLCKWLYGVGGSDISLLNKMLETAGGNTTKQFIAFSATGVNNMRIWTSYDSGNSEGVKVSIYCPSGVANGYSTTTQRKENATQGITTPILQFSYAAQ